MQKNKSSQKQSAFLLDIEKDLKNVKKHFSRFPKLDISASAFHGTAIGLNRKIHDFPQIKQGIKVTFGNTVEPEKFDGTLLGSHHGFCIVRHWGKNILQPSHFGARHDTHPKSRFFTMDNHAGILVPYVHPFYTFIYDSLVTQDLKTGKLTLENKKLKIMEENTLSQGNQLGLLTGAIYLKTPLDSIFVKKSIIAPKDFL